MSALDNVARLLELSLIFAEERYKILEGNFMQFKIIRDGFRDTLRDVALC